MKPDGGHDRVVRTLVACCCVWVRRIEREASPPALEDKAALGDGDAGSESVTHARDQGHELTLCSDGCEHGARAVGHRAVQGSLADSGAEPIE